jgi:hypothetical protein
VRFTVQAGEVHHHAASPGADGRVAFGEDAVHAFEGVGQAAIEVDLAVRLHAQGSQGGLGHTAFGLHSPRGDGWREREMVERDG